jgi:dCTP deaminase
MAANFLVIDPMPSDKAFQPASIEYRIDWGAEDYRITLKPGEFRLAHTLEQITVPDHLLVKAEGKSSWARLGLQVHATAGYVDPGFSGQVTLELKNLHHEEPIEITRHAVIGQFLVCRLSGPVQRPYGHPGLNSHYQGQAGTTPSWMQSP